MPRILRFLLIGSALGASACNTCETRAQAASADIYRVLATYQDCTIDDDCTLVDVSTACRGSCSEAVSVEGSDVVEEEVGIANGTHCANFPQDCGFATPDCPSVEAICDDGQCTTSE